MRGWRVRLTRSSGSTFLQRGSPPPPPWRLLLELFCTLRTVEMWFLALDDKRAVPYLPAHCGGVAQLVRALPCHGRGYGFEPRRSRHLSAFSGPSVSPGSLSVSVPIASGYSKDEFSRCCKKHDAIGISVVGAD